MSPLRLKKAILREALRLHSQSHRFPVKRFWIETKTGKCTKLEYDRDFAWLDDLMHLCGQLSEKAKP